MGLIPIVWHRALWWGGYGVVLNFCCEPANKSCSCTVRRVSGCRKLHLMWWYVAFQQMVFWWDPSVMGPRTATSPSLHFPGTLHPQCFSINLPSTQWGNCVWSSHHSQRIHHGCQSTLYCANVLRGVRDNTWTTKYACFTHTAQQTMMELKLPFTLVKDWMVALYLSVSLISRTR